MEKKGASKAAISPVKKLPVLAFVCNPVRTLVVLPRWTYHDSKRNPTHSIHSFGVWVIESIDVETTFGYSGSGGSAFGQHLPEPFY